MARARRAPREPGVPEAAYIGWVRGLDGQAGGPELELGFFGTTARPRTRALLSPSYPGVQAVAREAVTVGAPSGPCPGGGVTRAS